MLLEDIKKLTEARYTTGKETYFVQALDPEDGDISLYAGPFQDEQSAEKFTKQMRDRDKKRYKDRVNQDDLPSYYVEKLLPADEFIEMMDQHIEVFAD